MPCAGKSAIKKPSLGNFLIIISMFFGSIIVPLATSSSSLAQSATSEINAVIEDPTVALSVVSVEYVSINGQPVARVTAKVRFAENVIVYRNGQQIVTQSVTYGGAWTELVFDILLPSSDQMYEIIIQATNITSATVAEATVMAQHTKDPGDDGDGSSDKDDQSDAVGQNPWWPLPPNTGEIFVGTPQNFAIWLNSAIALTVILLVIAKRRKNITKSSSKN